MKKLLLSIAATLVTALSAVAQSTFTVKDGPVSWHYSVSDIDTSHMPFSAGTVSIAGRAFTLGPTVEMSVGNATVEPLTVSIRYEQGGAVVEAPGALAASLTISVKGQTVDITAAPALDQEVTYRLSGTGESFALHGDFKSTIVLDGVSLTAAGEQPALWVDNGKRIDIIASDATTNTFRDAATNLKKGAFHVKGHAEWKGGGNVSIAGTSRHAYSSSEYTWFKPTFTGTFSVTAAGSDGIHVEQYLQVDGGTITVKGNKGDGIDVSYTLEADGVTPTADEQNGQFLMNGGTISVEAKTADTKGLKCEDKMTITAGRINATADGDGSRGVQTGADLYLGKAGAALTDAYIYLTANGDGYTDPATGDVNKCRGLKVKKDFYHYPSTLERNEASIVTKKKVVDVDGMYNALGGTLKGITIQ